MSHPGRSHDIVQSQGRVPLYFRIVPGGAGELMAWSVPFPLGVYLCHPLYHLEQPGPARDTVGFQRGGDGQADRLLRAPLVCHHQVGGHGIQPPLHALHRGVERFQVTADIGPFFHARSLLPF